MSDYDVEMGDDGLPMRVSGGPYKRMRDHEADLSKTCRSCGSAPQQRGHLCFSCYGEAEE